MPCGFFSKFRSSPSKSKVFLKFKSQAIKELTPPLSFFLSVCVCVSLSLCPPPVDHDIGVEPLI